MRICYLCADRGIALDKRNGAATHVGSLVRAFSAAGHDIVVIAASAAGSDALGVPVVPIAAPGISKTLSSRVKRLARANDADIAQGSDRVASAVKHLWHNVAVERALEEVFAAFKPDVVYERYSPFGAAGALTARANRIPHVLEVNAPLAWEGATYRNQALGPAADLLERTAFDTTSAIVAVSGELRDALANANIDADKIEVVPNGVDTERFCPEGPAYRDGLVGKTVIGFVGSLKAWHGIAELADAFRRLSSNAALHLLVVGDGPMAEVVDSLANELPDRVTFVRAVAHDDVPAYLRAIDVALAPYPELERFYYSPLKVLEYMATGRPVVASSIGQLNDLIDDGDTGLLVPPGNVPAIVDAVMRLANDEDLRRRLGTRAAELARREFTWGQRASQIADIARGVIQ